MKRVKKIAYITLILIISLIIGGFLYINYWLGDLVADLSPSEKQQEQPETIEADSVTNDNIVNNKFNSTVEKSKDDVNDAETASISNPKGNNTITQLTLEEQPEKSKPVQQSSDSSNVDKSVSEIKAANSQVGNAVQQQLEKSVDKTDLVQAAMIIVKKLDKNDISFLSGFSSGDYTKDELIEARRVLLSKLDAEDIKTLRALGRKYGKKLEILDPSVKIE